MSTPTLLRNVAVIAHVDHGKTTLVDQLLYQSGQFRDAELDKLAGGQHGLIMDTGDLERERGITITAKNCAIRYTAADGRNVRINLIDTPGHADFGGEVERVLGMADGVLLLVDAAEGPMPQTRFVLGKALKHKLKPVVVVNKCDKPGARPDEAVNEVFDLLVELNADDDALDFPTVFCSGRDGWGVLSLENDERKDLRPLFETIIGCVPGPYSEKNPRTVSHGFTSREDAMQAPLQLMVTSLDFSDYVGRIAVGRVERGILKPGEVMVLHRTGERKKQRVLKVMAFDGLSKTETTHIEAGDLCAVVGLDPIDIGDTIADVNQPEALPPVAIDEPTVTMTFRVNDSPFAGREGKYVTSRQIKDRLEKELERNVALRVEPGESPEQFEVSGRGLLHLGVLIETMRREGYELQISMPRVIFKSIDGQTHEPIEELVVDCPADCQSDVMSLLMSRRAELIKMDSRTVGQGTAAHPHQSTADEYVHLVFTIPARGLIGLRTRVLTATQGRAILHHTFLEYAPIRGEIAKRTAGVIIASEPGMVTSYALFGLYDRGVFFVEPGEQVYEGQVVGEHNKDNDIVANVVRAKHVSAVRIKGKDENTNVKPARRMSLEQMLEYVGEDEYVEVTPENARIRKKLLLESDRRKESRKAKSAQTV